MPSTAREILIAPSILASNFVELARELRSIESADLIHVDVMDGHFVPNLTIGPPVVAAIKKVAPRPLDVHLMIERPEQYLEAYIDAGADILGVHAEACPHLHGTLGQIRKLGEKKGRRVRSCAVINPSTPAEVLEFALEETDQILVMTVNPGFGGQSYIPGATDKIRRVRGLLDARKSAARLEVDGGITAGNIAKVRAAGADTFVAGTAVFGAPDVRAAVSELHRLCLARA